MTSPANRLQPLNGNDKFSEQDHYWMQHALKLAERAASEQEVPVGAVIICNGELVAEGYNCPISTSDPTAHAEMVSLRNAAAKIGNYRLTNMMMYVTLEPCMMCAGAIIHSRLKQLIFGAPDPRTGVVLSQARLFDKSFLNHKIQYSGGLLAGPCGHILSQFFKERR